MKKSELATTLELVASAPFTYDYMRGVILDANKNPVAYMSSRLNYGTMFNGIEIAVRTPRKTVEF